LKKVKTSERNNKKMSGIMRCKREIVGGNFETGERNNKKRVGIKFWKR
jgi:hypothetical protein